MYISIRKYNVKASDEFTKKVKEKFMPLISKAPGFISYYGISINDTTWTSVSIFQSHAQAEESNKIAAEWVKQDALSLVNAPPEIIAGEVGCHISALDK